MAVAQLQQSEKQFQAAVIELARLRGWRVAHFHDSRRQVGDRLVGDADAAGFPDLCMVRDGHLVFAELKAEKGRVSPAQHEWISVLEAVADWATDGVEVHVWRPSQWSEIEQVLR